MRVRVRVRVCVFDVLYLGISNITSYVNACPMYVRVCECVCKGVCASACMYVCVSVLDCI